MTFDLDTLSFSFLFLPAVLLCFTLAPQRCKNGVLVAASLILEGYLTRKRTQG